MMVVMLDFQNLDREKVKAEIERLEDTNLSAANMFQSILNKYEKLHDLPLTKIVQPVKIIDISTAEKLKAYQESKERRKRSNFRIQTFHGDDYVIGWDFYVDNTLTTRCRFRLGSAAATLERKKRFLWTSFLNMEGGGDDSTKTG